MELFLSKKNHKKRVELIMENQGLVKPGSTHELTVPTDMGENVRLDHYLARQFRLYSRSFFKRLIEEGRVFINGKQTIKQATMLKPHDQVRLSFPQERAIERTCVMEQTGQISIIHMSEHFLIINKPAGLAVHQPTTAYKEPTLVDWLLLNHQDVAHIGYVDRPGIVHRLDKDTSGLMIIARTNYAHTKLSSLFKERQVHKIYHALVAGHPAPTGTIILPIGRHPKHRNKMTVHNVHTAERCSGTIRDAMTNYRVLTYFNNCALVEVKPLTGRTHQIRVHFAAIGHPLLGDLLYGNKSPFMKRHALHAYALAFTLHGTQFTFTHEAPHDFTQAVATLTATSHEQED